MLVVRSRFAMGNVTPFTDQAITFGVYQQKIADFCILNVDVPCEPRISLRPGSEESHTLGLHAASSKDRDPRKGGRWISSSPIMLGSTRSVATTRLCPEETTCR
ncbi:hypothetical protein MES5069_160026 [Mesorhizobium escarrei]|uniref:Uncharacterized protein n=1 Tax=Mesorhizobium escarrei TaxID=666018 RepID=A0ABM9DK82_9HYPH|nr:hypothetical protein MES5069_160026 [Mesorhizobium escarrei]